MALLDIADMRRQHDAAEQIAASIIAALAGYDHEYDAIPIVRQLAKLNTLLRVHFLYEDSILYPAMITRGDRDAATLALTFHQEMGSLAMRFEDFVRRWSSPIAIAACFEDFRGEATGIMTALGARIERENDQLYPLAAQLVPRAA